MREVRVHLLPGLFEPEELRGGVAVVIDVLRASTVIVHALANGARAVVPCLTVEESRQAARGLQRGGERSNRSENDVGGVAVLLGGEREGLHIPGFDLDNNPLAYTADVVQGKTIVFTTTNGTAALHRASQADRILIGTFVNLQAVVDVLAADRQPVHLVCAGTKGRVTVEDVLCAGAIVDRLAAALELSPVTWTDDQLQLAWRAYASVKSDATAFREALRNSFGGRNCRRLGFDEQIDRAGTFDMFAIVPEYDHAKQRIGTSD